MTQTVVVPLDGSTLAEGALPYGASLSQALGMRLVLYEVVTHGRTLAETESDMQEIQRWLAAAGVRAECETTVGGPSADKILDEIAALRAALVVMSSHGRHGLGRWRYGSVAFKVAHHAPVPVLVVRCMEEREEVHGSDRPPFVPQAIRSILVPLDGSRLSEEILPLATRLARGLQATVTLLRVVPIPPPREARRYFSRHIFLQLMDETVSYLGETAASLASEGIEIATQADSGDPGEVIHEYAEAGGFDLIAMTTRGRRGITRWLMGSVAERLFQVAAKPLLLARPGAAQAPLAGWVRAASGRQPRSSGRPMG